MKQVVVRGGRLGGKTELMDGALALARGCQDHPGYRAKRAPRSCAICAVLWDIAEKLRKAGVEV